MNKLKPQRSAKMPNKCFKTKDIFVKVALLLDISAIHVFLVKHGFFYMCSSLFSMVFSMMYVQFVITYTLFKTHVTNPTDNL